MFLASKLGLLLTVLINVQRGLCYRKCNIEMKYFTFSRARFDQIRKSSLDTRSIYCTSNYMTSRRGSSALKSSVEDGISRTDYELLDCGDLKRLERFAGITKELFYSTRVHQTSIG